MVLRIEEDAALWILLPRSNAVRFCIEVGSGFGAEGYHRK